MILEKEASTWDRKLSEMDLPFVVLLLAVLHGTSAIHFHSDKVISLPGAPLYPEFNLFSGYLNGSSNATSVPIFYVLAEAIRVDPSTAPLVVWFNGGPGVSSLATFLKEHGPYRVTEEGSTLTYNEFSWNQYANILYIESPLGFGFSQNSEREMTLNDLDAAELNFYALKDFMTRAHAGYVDRDYYLGGVSYAGAYVPYFARRLLVGIESGEMDNKQFKGFAIGNPVIHIDESLGVAEAMQYISYGVMPPRLSGKVLLNWWRYQRGKTLNQADLSDMMNFLYDDIYKNIGRNSSIYYNFVEHCYDPSLAEEDYHKPMDKTSIGCYGHNAVTSYLNRIDVQKALHVLNSGAEAVNWTSLNNDMNVEYDRDFNMLHVYEDIFTMINDSSFRVLIYHGDTDVRIPPLQTMNSANQIAEANSLEDQEYDRAWRFYGDFAGIRTGYKKGNISMDVLTVRGAGHSVPQALPAQAFQIINKFLSTEDNEAINYSDPIRKRSYPSKINCLRKECS